MDALVINVCVKSVKLERILWNSLISLFQRILRYFRCWEQFLEERVVPCLIKN